MSIITWFTGLGPAIKGTLVGVSALALVVGSATVTHKVDLASYEKLQLSQAAHANDTLVHSLDLLGKQVQVNADLDLKYGAADQQIMYVTQTVLKEIPIHVTAETDRKYPVPYGTIRVLDAEVLGVDPNSLALPSGAGDGDTAPVANSVLAGTTTTNYATCKRALNDLANWQTWYTEQKALTDKAIADANK
jgi:hypothetical protein